MIIKLKLIKLQITLKNNREAANRNSGHKILINITNAEYLKYNGKVDPYSIRAGFKATYIYATDWANKYAKAAEDVYEAYSKTLTDLNRAKSSEQANKDLEKLANVVIGLTSKFERTKQFSNMSGDLGMVLDQIPVNSANKNVAHIINFKLKNATRIENEYSEKDLKGRQVSVYDELYQDVLALDLIVEGLINISKFFAPGGIINRARENAVANLKKASFVDSMKKGELQDVNAVSFINSIHKDYSIPLVTLTNHIVRVFNAGDAYVNKSINAYLDVASKLVHSSK